MKRRRAPLQVSLFPFLSVLLCTLGALILLLLVLDQKSRQARAEENARQEQAALENSAEERDRQQRLLQERLQAMERQRRETDEQLQALQGEEADRAARLEQQQRELAAARARLADEQQRSAQLENAIRQQQGSAAELQQQRQANEKELARLQAQIALLEQTVQRLQELERQKQRPRYSLVPYKGNRGTDRPPLFAECTSSGLRFQPAGGSLTLDEVLDSKRLLTAIAKALPKGSIKGDDRPYVLLLVRPSGIKLHYAVFQALKDSNIDVGYEFIDEDWVLDFSPTGESPPPSLAGRPAEPMGTGTGHGERPTTASVGSAGLPRPAGPVQPDQLVPPPPILVSRPRDSSTPEPRPSGEPVVRDQGRRTPPPKPEEPLPKPMVPGASGPASDSNQKLPRPVRPVPVGEGSQREWEVVLECAADHVLIQATKAKINVSGLPKGANPLLGEVEKLVVQRRKANPEVQPRLKFIIHPDGLRTYYLAAAVVESLNLPSVRQVLEVEGQNEPPAR